MAPVELLGFLAGGIGMLFGLPQARHVRAVGHGRGVSLTAWMLMFAVSASWAAYGLRVGAASIIVTNIIAGLINGSVVVVLVGHGRRPFLWLPLFAGVVVAAVLLLPQTVVSAALVALVFAQVPQVFESVRSLRAGRATAVSLDAMFVGQVSLVCWGAYALVSHTSLMILTTALALLMNLTITVLEFRVRRALSQVAA